MNKLTSITAIAFALPALAANLEYTVAWQSIDTYFETGGNAYSDHQGIIALAGGHVEYTKQVGIADVRASLTTQQAPEGMSATLIHNMLGETYGVGSTGYQVYFRTDTTTSFEASCRFELYVPNSGYDLWFKLSEVSSTGAHIGYIFDVQAPIDGTPLDVNIGGIISSTKYYFLQLAVGGGAIHEMRQDMTFRVTDTPVPEPSHAVIAGLALAGVWLVRRARD